MKYRVSQLTSYLAGILSVGAFTMTVIDAPLWGVALSWAAAYSAVAATPESRRRHLALVTTMLLVLGISPLGTSTEINPGAIMTLGMLVAVGLPFLVRSYQNQILICCICASGGAGRRGANGDILRLRHASLHQ